MKILISLFLFAFPFVVTAQSGYVNIYTTVSYNSSTDQATAYAYSEPDYVNAMYYETYVNGNLKFQGTTIDNDQNSGSGWTPEIWLSGPGDGCGTYEIVSGHWQMNSYYVENYWYNGSEFTGWWDEYNFSSEFSGGMGEGPGTDGNYVESYQFEGPGPALSTWDTVTIFGNAEDFSNGDCSSMPSVSITEFKAVGEGKRTKAYVTVSNNSNNDPITLTLAPKSGQSGSATFVSSGTNTRTITASGEVEIEGVTQSNTKDSMQLKATFTKPDTSVATLDKEDFTVIEVTLSLKMSNNISSDNERSSHINTVLGTTTLGGAPFVNPATYLPAQFRHMVEIKAAILPTNFNLPVKLQRQIVENRSFRGQADDQRFLGCADTSLDEYRDDTPSSSGFTYDIDAPGFVVPGAWSDGEIKRRRTNFKQWLTLNQNYSNSGAQDVIVSGEIEWYQRMSILKVSGASQSVETTVSGDNVVGSGTTLLTWNLTSGGTPMTAGSCP